MKGGKREGAGRPKGSFKAEGARPQHQVRAYPDEWELIRKFSKLVKSGKKNFCAELLEKIGRLID